MMIKILFNFTGVKILTGRTIRLTRVKFIHILLHEYGGIYDILIMSIACTVMHSHCIQRAGNLYITCRSFLQKEYLFVSFHRNFHYIFYLLSTLRNNNCLLIFLYLLHRTYLRHIFVEKVAKEFDVFFYGKKIIIQKCA